MTSLDLIKSSFRLLGVYGAGDTPTSEDANDALAILNMLIGSWNNEGLMVYQILDETFSLVNGTASYTIGTSQTFNTTRPIKIDSAFVRDSASIDYSVKLVTSEEYRAISEKALKGIPSRLYYNAAYPNGTIYLWPVPDYAYTIGLSQWKQLSTFAALTTTISLPPGYEMLLRYGLAIELAPEWGKTIAADIANGFQRHKIAIQNNNNRKKLMQIDRQWLGSGKYEILSDTFV